MYIHQTKIVRNQKMTKLRIAIQGCCHGELNQVFKQVAKLHSETPIDLLLILGDFQSIRNETDFQSISIPKKYQRYGDFQEYYQNDEYRPPVLTLFIGGNHESMRHLMLLPNGGYVANNIYYMGYSNVIWYRGLRIGSLSGIWKKWDFYKKRPDWDELETKGRWSEKVRELYHVRSSDVIPLFMIRNSHPIDVMMSHDWPTGVVYHGNFHDLLRKKPYFEKDVQTRQLGNPISWKLLRQLKPKWWLSAHLHVKYEATIKDTKRKKNDDEVELDLSSDNENDNVIRETQFLALDKCLPKRKWLEIIEVDADISHPSWSDKDTLYWDPEFINNLQYVKKNNDEFTNADFSDFHWNGDKVKQVENWSEYAIPHYINGIQRKEKEQTLYFNERFF